jgi:membrane protein YdbS with pleckstrin-like domain
MVQAVDSAGPEGGDALATRMSPLHPSHLWVLRIRGLILLVPLLVAGTVAGFGLREVGVPVGLVPGLAALVGLALLLVLPARRHRAWAWREDEDELHVAHGLLVRTHTIVPFGRVQHIDIAQGPIERPFGLATLILHTAGTRGAAVPLPGLPRDQAEAMRDRIRSKIRQELA